MKTNKQISSLKVFSFHFWFKVGKKSKFFLEKKQRGEKRGVGGDKSTEKSRNEVIREEKEGVEVTVQKLQEHQKSNCSLFCFFFKERTLTTNEKIQLTCGGAVWRPQLLPYNAALKGKKLKRQRKLQSFSCVLYQRSHKWLFRIPQFPWHSSP